MRKKVLLRPGIRKAVVATSSVFLKACGFLANCQLLGSCGGSPLLAVWTGGGGVVSFFLVCPGTPFKPFPCYVVPPFLVQGRLSISIYLCLETEHFEELEDGFSSTGELAPGRTWGEKVRR